MLDLDSPAARARAVTPSDTTDLSSQSIRYLYIGGNGNIRVTMLGGGDVTFVGVVAGSILRIQVTKVLSTLTTATNIVALS